jgi:MFS superfamily sulfate permease-like transporter
MSHAMALSFTHGAVVFCSDTILAGIVAYLISHLQLGRKTKIASGVLLSLGSM